MDFESVIKKRKSVREFKKKKPSWKLVLDAIDIANQGPYANNENHIKYIILEEKETIENVAKACEQDWIANSKLVVVVLSDDTNLEGVFGDRGRVYSRQQAGAAIKTFQLALTNQGIDSCWIGACDDNEIRRILKIPKEITQVEAVIPLGFAQKRTKKPLKKSLEASIFWESWGNDKRPALLDEHSAHDFQRPTKK